MNSLLALYRQLDLIYEMAGKESEAPIGALTTENRDVWAKARAQLIAFHPKNKEHLDIIETAAFVLCLDDSKPISREELSVACWHGDGRNRFFDKSIQFIVFDNGKAGFNGEHSNMEATITHRLCDWVCEGYGWFFSFTLALIRKPSI
jgi:carnitine O-acetyltransferase